MFVSSSAVRRIERAEAEMMRSMVEAVIASGRAPDAFARALGGGVATYLRPGSPMNKIIGAGLDAAIDEGALADVEVTLRAHGEPPRVELATLAHPDAGVALTARGYRLLGFENVLARSLSAAPSSRGSAVRVERVTAANVAAWKQTSVDATAVSDETGVPVDHFSLDAIVAVFDDVVQDRSFLRYLAFADGALAGAASMRLHDGVALFTGSATLVEHRRHGVQAALIAARLDEARARDAELAVITTAPGSLSQANVMKHGFSLAYARAILAAPG